MVMFVFDQLEYSSQLCRHLDLKSKEVGRFLRGLQSLAPF